MSGKNGRLMVVLGGVVVLAVVGGIVLAALRGPADGDGATAPLAGTTSPAVSPSTSPSSPVSPTAGPSGSPSGVPGPTRTPTVSPSARPTPATTSRPRNLVGPAKLKVELSRLPRGRAPQLAYVSGREARGGPSGPVTIPGTGQIHQVARLNIKTLAVVTKAQGTELLRIRRADSQVVEHEPDVHSLVATDDGTGAAYATKRYSSTGSALQGSVVFAEKDVDPPRKLALPTHWNVDVLAYVDGTVYFRSAESRVASTYRLYQWRPGATTATKLESGDIPTGVAGDGSVMAAIKNLAESGSCSVVSQVRTRQQRWRTCDYQVTGFSPTGSLAIGEPAYGDGYAPLMVAALDGATGNLLREWSGLTVTRVVAEDDDHLLMRADNGPESDAAIVRCSVTTGACELATPVSSQPVVLAS